MLELISTAADGLQIVKALTDDRRSPNPKLDRLDDAVVEALRGIYFTPKGIVTLLEQVAAGAAPDPQQVEERLPNFNDAEWRVGRALEILDFEDGAPPELSLKRARTLERLRYGKINLRRDIQMLLNFPLTYDGKISADEAGHLLERVRELNAQIEALEEAHNYRARR